MAFGYKWLKPELDEPRYWVHLVILAVVILGVLEYFYGGEMFTIKNILLAVPLLGFADFIAHTVLQLD